MALLLEDTFTDVDGTLLGNHSGETAAAWASNMNFGSGDGNADEFIVRSNRLRRVNFDDLVGYAGGTALAYPPLSPDLDTVPNYDVTFQLRFDTGVVNSELSLYHEADADPGNGERLASFVAGGLGRITSVGGGVFPFTFVDDQDYTVRFSVRGDTAALYIDGALLDTKTGGWPHGTSPTGKFGLAMFDTGADSKVSVDNLSLESVAAEFYRDEFNGSGSLDGHTSDSGHGYMTSVLSTGFIPINVTSGYAVSDSTSNSRIGVADAPLPVGVPFLEASLLFAASISANVRFVAFHLYDPASAALPDGNRLGFAFRFLGGVTEVWAYNGDTSVTTGIEAVTGSPSPYVDQIVTITATLESSELVLTLNGTEVYRASVGTVVTTGWVPVITLRSAASNDTRLLRGLVRVTAPDAPDAFWTQRVRATEVI